MATDLNLKLDSTRLLNLFVDHLEKEHSLKRKDILEMLKVEKEPLSIPLSIFSARELGSFECIVKYLHEELLLPFSQISKLTNRDQRTIWASYHSSKKKHPSALQIMDSGYQIPLRIIFERRLSVLEAIVVYLKESYSPSFSRIATLLRRDPRTIHTIKTRAELKNAQ